MLPTNGQYRNTYISENALMPSQAYSYFRESEWNILRGYRTQIDGMDPADVEGNMQVMGDWFRDIGFKVEFHKTEYNTTNLYAIWHAPRADGTEAMVLGASYFQSDELFNIGGLSLLFSLSRFFHRWSIWSKNLIFIIPQDPGVSLRSWVDAYHNSLENYVGSIESAIMMDYASNSDNFEYVELYYDGLNGQLPNLDLVNVCVYVTEHEGPRISLQNIPREELRVNTYWARLKILLLGFKNLSLTGISKFKGQEAFSGWKIQSLTLKAIPDENGSGPFDITTFGRVPEAIFRSVNNLLEKFHQSFFFYFLLQTRNFVSIGTYLPSGGLIIASFILSFLDNIFNEFGSGSDKTFLVVDYLNDLGSALITSILGGFIVFEIGVYLPLPLAVVILIGASVAISTSSNFIKIKSNRQLKSLLRALSLGYIIFSFTSLVTLNFALTLSLSSLSIPLTFIKNNRKLNNLLLLVTNPFIQILVISQFEIIDDEASQLGNILVFFEKLISSWSNFGNHTWLVLTIGCFPSWLLMSYSNLLTIEEDDGIKEKKQK